MTDRDPSGLERRLRGALHPVEPPVGFADNVMARLRRARARSHPSSATATRPSNRRWLQRRPAWFTPAAAAALAAVLVGAGLWNQQRAQELRAREARDQVLEALVICSRALNTALHVSVDPSRPG
jgi:hypothetical protein